LFTVDLVRATGGGAWSILAGVATILGVVHGALTARGGGQEVAVAPGAFCLLPAGLGDIAIELQPGTQFLQIVPG
jgi:hypothetical protein